MKLEVTGLTKCYGKAQALKELSLQVESARIVALIGPSGGGKSTLLRVLGGLETPDKGSITVNAHALPKTSQELQAYRRRNGFLFQQFNLFPHLTALKNITLPLEKVHGYSTGRAIKIAEETLDRFGLADHQGKLPAQLSGGQQQRAAIARAVAHQPELLFLDEPTSALDPEMTAEVLGLIQELALAGQDIIFSTHEMGFAKVIANQIAFVAKGKIEELASPAHLFSEAASPICRRFLSKVMRY